MGKRELEGGGNYDPTPCVNITNPDGKAGATFVGELVEMGREQKMASGSTKWIYGFLIKDGDAPVSIKEGDKYVEADVKENDRVVVFATKALHSKLAKAEVGMTLELVYNGLKLNPKTKRKFHDVTVNVIE